MKIIILLSYLLFTDHLDCNEIVGKWQSIAISEDHQIIDACKQNIDSCLINNRGHVTVSYQMNGEYVYRGDGFEIVGKYFINRDCDSLGITINNKQTKIN